MGKKQVWKFAINPKTTLEMPKGASILTMQLQNGIPCIWALVNPENEKELRYFEIYGTGDSIDCVGKKYIGTFQVQSSIVLVYHLFERVER